MIPCAKADDDGPARLRRTFDDDLGGDDEKLQSEVRRGRRKAPRRPT